MRRENDLILQVKEIPTNIASAMHLMAERTRAGFVPMQLGEFKAGYFLPLRAKSARLS
jgi:hypothetical protein